MNNPPADHSEHGAWLDSLTPDELLVVELPQGYRHVLILAALSKCALQTKGITPGLQLQFLENMDALLDRQFTAEMLAMIEPSGDLEYEIYRSAKSLDPPDDKRGKASFEILTSPRVFWHLCTLNPSFLAALRCHAGNTAPRGTLPAAGHVAPFGVPPAATRHGPNAEIPERFLTRRPAQQFAKGSPHEGGFNVHTGR